jgi:hypothetical protein
MLRVVNASRVAGFTTVCQQRDQDCLDLNAVGDQRLRNVGVDMSKSTVSSI